MSAYRVADRQFLDGPAHKLVECISDLAKSYLTATGHQLRYVRFPSEVALRMGALPGEYILLGTSTGEVAVHFDSGPLWPAAPRTP